MVKKKARCFNPPTRFTLPRQDDGSIDTAEGGVYPVRAYVAYPVGLKDVVIGQGDRYEEALADVKSAVAFHIETFGADVLDEEDLAQEVFIAETGMAV